MKPSDAGSALIAQQLDQAYAAGRTGDLKKADALYRAVLARDPRNVDALIGMGNVAWQRGNPETAGDLYQRVLEIDPGNAAAQAELISLSGQVDPVASETRLKQLIAREPSGYLYAALGHLHADQGQWPQAQQAYFQAYQLEPNNPDYAFNLAIGLEHLNQQKVAATYYRKALALARSGGASGFDAKQVEARLVKIGEPVE